MSPLGLEAKTVRSAYVATDELDPADLGMGGAESVGPRRRFRVLVRRPLPPPGRLRRAAPQNPIKRALMIAGIPALLLVGYVALWTQAMHDGYYKQHLSREIQALQIENDALQTELRRLQSPRRIRLRAERMGMRSAHTVEFVDGTGGRRVALAVPANLQASPERVSRPVSEQP